MIIAAMRILIVALTLVLTACASPGSDVGNRGDDFEPIAAARTRISLGLTYLKNGNYQQAKFNLDKALTFAPRFADAHYSMAYYYQVVGEIELADEAYKQSLRLEPHNPDIANTYGAFLCQHGKYDQAQQYFLKAINSTNYVSTAESYENLALCSRSQGHNADALQYMQSAINHQPSRARSLLLLSQWQAEDGFYDDAKSNLKRFERQGQVSAESLWLATKIEHALGELEEARNYGEMLKSVYPQHEYTQLYVKNVASDLNPPQETVRAEQPVEAEPAVAAEPQHKPEQQPESLPVETASEPEISESAVSQTVQSPDVSESPASHYHVVQEDENLYRISLKYNIKLQRLIEWNNLEDGAAIKAGATLLVVDPQSTEK